MTLSITLGTGRANPQGKVVAVDSAESLAATLSAIPPVGEQWWSLHTWDGGKRKGDRWVSSAGVGIDLDYEDQRDPDPEKWAHLAPPADVAASMLAAAESGLIPGSLFHLTPRGARVVFVFREAVVARDLMARAARGAGAQVAAAVEAAGLPVGGPGRAGYNVDEQVLIDLARLLFTPRCAVNGIVRDARVVVMRPDGFDAKDLAPAARVLSLVQPKGDLDIKDLVARYNAEHPREYPRDRSTCPVCGHHGCFGAQGGAGSPRWSCFSANHPAGAGLKGPNCYTGDALDIDAHLAERSTVDHLKACGYMGAPPAPRRRDADVVPIRSDDARSLSSNDFASICFVLRTPDLREKVLGRGVLEFNEMTLSVTLGRRRVEEEDYLRVRELCKTELGETDTKGFKYSRADIQDAMLRVAKERKHHPVSDYLRSLVWDGTPRVDRLAAEVLNVAPSPLASTLIRKWLISACARVEQPGCKAHGVLIFVGPGGVGKSTFFEVLASPTWFGDTAMDLNDKSDAYLKLHTTWIYEWGELESMQRARSQNTVKAFITSPSDRFRAPYAREMEIHLRRFVLCGTANPSEAAILTESAGGGNRRYWILETPNAINLDLLAEWRDQVWAEVYAAYRAGEPWHLVGDESDDLEQTQGDYVRVDAWADRITAWISQMKIAETSVSEVLAGAIEKPLDSWNERDEARVARILRDLRWERRKKGARYVYVNPEMMPF